MRQLWVLVLGLMLAGLAAAPHRAAALDCVAPEETLDRMDVIVRGKVIAIESPGWFGQVGRRQVQIEVEKYHKGSGPRILTGFLAPIDSGYGGWMNSADVGDGILGAFRYEGKELVSRPCDLWMVVWADGLIPEPIASKLPPGRDPEPGGPAAAGVSSAWGWGAALVVVAVGAVVLWRVRRS